MELVDVLGRDLDAVGDPLLPVGVVGAAVGAQVEQAAAGVRQRHLARVHVLDLDLAAQAAAVAERLPLGLGHLLEALLAPEAGTDGMVRALGHAPAPVSYGPARGGDSKA